MTSTVNGSVTETARAPIDDVAAWAGAQDYSTRNSLKALGELLVGVADRQLGEDGKAFTYRHLDVKDWTGTADEDRDLTGVSRLTAALALAELIETYGDRVEIGPGQHLEAPAWTVTTVGTTEYRHPQALRVAFPAGTLLETAPCVLQIETRQTTLRNPELTAHVRVENQDEAAAALDAILRRGDALHPYRGRVLRVSREMGLSFSVFELPPLSRETVIVADEVWHEVDLGTAAVRDQHTRLNAAGWGSRRGLLLCGSPGVGKSAATAVVANELQASGFTVIYVDHRGAELLSTVVDEAQRIGGPILLVLEDVDLWCRDRRAGSSGGLGELLQAMDISPSARILTLASTNDPGTLDAAAVRTGRFDSVVTVGYPTRDDAARILTALLAGLPGGDTVDTAAVAARLPERTSGSDLREIVRRATLAAGPDGVVSTAVLTAEVGAGRYRATVPDGHYL